ncbi:hypothetical protein T09_10299, partial [Trichinella sp. T9]
LFDDNLPGIRDFSNEYDFLFKFLTFSKNFFLLASTRIKCIETISHPDDNMRPANDNCIRHVHPASSAFFLSINIERPVFTELLVLLHHLTFENEMPVIWNVKIVQ